MTTTTSTTMTTTYDDEPTVDSIDLGHLLVIYEMSKAYLDMTTDTLARLYQDTGKDRSTIEDHNATVDSLKYFAQLLYNDPSELDKYYIGLSD